MAKRNLDMTGSDTNKAPERRRRTTAETPGKTAAAPKPRGRRKTDVPADRSVVASAAETTFATPDRLAPVTAEAAIEAPVTISAPVSAPAGNGGHLTAEAGNGHERPVQLSHEDIALRAYHLYLERGGKAGDQFQDWITAERQLRERTLGQ